MVNKISYKYLDQKIKDKYNLNRREKTRLNRENAKKSTGPRTVSGKEKVSGNALSHG